MMHFYSGSPMHILSGVDSCSKCGSHDTDFVVSGYAPHE